MSVEQALDGRTEDEAIEPAPPPDGDDVTVADEAPAAKHTDHPELRALVTRWADAAESPYHRVLVKKLGERVEIGDVVRTPFAAVELQVETTELRCTPFETPAPDATDLTPLARSLEDALPLLPALARPAEAGTTVEEETEHLAWTETIACPACDAGRVRCGTCGGQATVACACGSGIVDIMVEETAACPLCSGSGKTEPRVCTSCGGKGSTQCSSCWGTRRLPDKRPCDRCKDGIVSCAICGGSGNVIGRCLKCTGLGSLPQQIARPITCPTCAGAANVPCADCELGRQPCERCRASGSVLRGERVRRAVSVGPVQHMTSDPLPVSVDPFAAAVAFTACDAEAVGGIAARLADTPALAEEFLEVAREGIAGSGIVSGRYGSAAVVTFTARLGTWTAEFAGVECGAERSIECTSGMQPPVDPKPYTRWIGKENATRTAVWEEADAAAEAVYRAALDQYKREVEAATAAAAASAVPPAATPAGAAPSAAPAPAPAATPAEPIARLRWSEDPETPAGEPPAEEPKERKGRLGLGRLVRRRRDDAHDETKAETQAETEAGSAGTENESDGDSWRLPPTHPVRPASTPLPPTALIPAPVRREVPPPDLLPAYAGLPPEVRIA